MAQFSGQTGSLEKHGNNWTVVYRYREPDQVKWRKKRITICPITGPGALGPFERERRKLAVLEQAGVNTEQTIKAQIIGAEFGGVTFQQQAESWLYTSQIRKRDPIAEATAKGYRSYLRNHLHPILGELPLSAVDNDALKRLVEKLHEKQLSPKTITNIVETAKLVVASLKVNGEEVNKRTWDNEYIDLPAVDPEDQNSEAFTPEEMTRILDTARKVADHNPAYMLALTIGGLGLRIGEALAIRVGDNIACPHCKALRPRKCQHGTTFSEDCRILHVRQSAYETKLKPPKTKNGKRDVDVPESLAAIFREYLAGKRPGTLVFSSRTSRPLLQRNINRDWLHPILESVGLRTAERWRDANGGRKVKCLSGTGKAWHAMRRFRSTHLEAELIPETLIKLWLGHGKKGVTEQSYIKIMGRVDVRRKYVESVGLGFSHVPNVPTRSVEKAA